MKPGIVATYVSAASFSVAGDLTADFVAGVRVLADCGVDGTPLGVVTAASHADGATTVTVAPDSGSLTANLAHVWHSNDTPESLCHHGHSGPADGGDLAAYVKRDNSRPFTQGHITGQGPYTGFKFVETGEDVAADAGKWIVQVDGGQLTVFCVNDAETEFNAAVTVDRAGATPTAVTLAAPYLGLDGDVDVSGALYTDNLLGQDVSGGTVDALVSKASAAEGVAGTEAVKLAAPAVLRQAYRSWQRDDAGRFPGLILPAYNLFAPNLALPGTTTFTRASSGWVVGAAGIVKTYATNAPRWDYDADGNLLGLRIEGAATRLNTIAAAPTAPENVAVTAQAYTVSFYGAGSVVLSGAHAATVNGAGVLPARASYTFTPTAGTLTITPSGVVQHLQVEAGSYATSPILGEGSTVTRAADVPTVALSGIDFNTAEGSFFIDAIRPFGATDGFRTFCALDNGSTSERILIYVYFNTLFARHQSVAGGAQALSLGVVGAGTRIRVGFSWKSDALLAVLNGGEAVTGTPGAVSTGLTTLRIGQGLATSAYLNSTIRHLAYFPRALTTEQLQAITL